MEALILKECRQTLKSLIYYIYLVAFVLFITSQMSSSDWISKLDKPMPGQEDYGMDYTTDQEVIMASGIDLLQQEMSRNSFATYPFGFYKSVTLSGEELDELSVGLKEATGMGMEELNALYEDYWQDYEGSNEDYAALNAWAAGWHVPIREGYTYQEFEGLMQKASDIIGAGCEYEERYKYTARAPVSYEQAVKNYEDLREKDRVSGAQMRLFCDYAGIFLGFFPCFLGVSICLRDKRAKAAEVIYSKQISGLKLIAARYAANVIMLFVPIVLCALLIQMPCVYEAAKRGISADYFAFIKYSVLWLLPTIMAMLAAAFLITEAAENLLAVPILFCLAAASLFGAQTLRGNFGYQLILRWNTFGKYSRYAEELGQLYRNRGFYTVLAILCILLAAAVYENKRKEGRKSYAKAGKAHC